jgi:hypothetical protein
VTAPQAASVRFGRLERRGLLLGLSASQVGTLAVGLLVLLVAEYASGVAGVLVTAPIWTLLAAAALIVIRGRAVVEWLPLVTHWLFRRALRATVHLTRPGHVGNRETVVLPGIPGRLMVTASPGTGAALVRDVRSGTVTAIAEVSGRGFLLDDAGTQDRRVAGWARFLSALCQQPDVARVQVLHRSVPDGAARVRRWWADHACADAPWAARVVVDLLAEATEDSDRLECLLAVAVRVRRGSLEAVERQLAAFTEALAAADLDVHGWVSPRRLRMALRAAYDPDGASRAQDAEPGGPLMGPMGLAEDWSFLRTDTACHVVYWVSEWPRSEVHPSFLRPLLLTPGARRSFTLIAEPLPPGRALREIRRAKAEHLADATQRARIGQVEDETTRAAAAELTRREQDLVAGHGDLRFVGLLTVTAATPEELAAACAATEAAAAQAGCEVRRLVGQQGQAHAAAALPLARGLA